MRLRPPRMEDAPAVLALLEARDVADLGAPDFTLADLQQQWRSRELDLAADAVVLEDGDGRSRLRDRARAGPETPAAFREEHLEAHDLAPELSRVAERDGVPVGFILCRVWDSRQGYVDLLGVDPGERGRRLGGLLLQTAFAGFAAHGLREALLGVASDNPRALRLYERNGIVVKFRVDIYERPVGAVTPGSGAGAPPARA